MRPIKKGIHFFLLLLVVLASQHEVLAQQRKRYKKQKTVFTENMPKYDRRLFHFGINLGLAMRGAAVRPIGDLRQLLPDTIYAVNQAWQPGFTMGIESNLRLGEMWDLRFTPTLTLAGRTLLFDRPKGVVEEYNLSSTFVEFPLYIKFKSVRVKNFRAYLIGGAKYSYDISHKIGAKDAGKYPVKTKPHDVTADIGFGFDFYLPFFKLSTQMKTSFGLLNLKYEEDNPYNRAIRSIESRTIYITFVFE